jgi:signal transduction histidine kinase
MTLRCRLLLIIGLSLTVLWAAASVWMLVDLRKEFRSALDERLAASAQMVANLVLQLPATSVSPAASPPAVVDVLGQDGVACEVRLLRGGLIARTQNSPATLGFTGTGYSTRTIQGVQWRSYTVEQRGVRITTADRVDRRVALLRGIVLATAVPFLIAAAGGLAALWLGVRHGLSPLVSIRDALAERDPDALQHLPVTRVPGELKPLVATINSLLDRIQRAIERERTFTGNAAHELRTPLTAVKTHIQVARLAGGGSETGIALVHAEQGVLRLQSTIEQLLMLARVDSAQSFDGEQAVGGRAIAEMAVQQTPAEHRGRILIRDLGAAGALSVPPVLALTAARNILDNACRYSPAGTEIVLTVSDSNGSASFSVEDRGPGMTEVERVNAMQRFWRKGHGQGSGLGLSIVHAITERYGGSVALLPRTDGGLAALLTFPLAGVGQANEYQ